MTARCPSDLALEKHLLDPEASPQRAHVDGCAACQARLTEMRKQGEDFMRFVFPATVDAVEAAAEKPRFSLARWFAPVPALAAAAAILVVLNPGQPPDDYTGQKGGAGGLGLTVFVKDAAGVKSIRDGAEVRADASLRFKVSSGKACRLWILSLDAEGEVSRLYPEEGTGGAPLAGVVEIPGGAVLDGKAGPERIYAVCTPQASKWKALGVQIKGTTGAGAAGVRAERQARGLPAGSVQDSLLLEKRT